MQNKGAAAVCERLRLDVRDGLMSPAPHALQVAALDSDGEDDGEYDDPEGEAWLPDDFIALANSDDPTASWGGEEDDDANGEMTEEDHWRRSTDSVVMVVEVHSYLRSESKFKIINSIKSFV